MSIISGFNKVKNYVKTTEGYKLLSRWTSSDTVDVNGKTLTEVVDELGTASKKDVAASGNASTTQVIMGNDTRLTDARKASDVSAWAKASTKPTYTASEVGLGNVGNFKAVSTVASQGLTDAEKSNARANIGAQPSGSYASASHTHDDRYYTESEINTKLNGKANSSHTHGNGDITSLDASKITSGTIDLARLPQGALDRLVKVADDTARFKLTTKDVQLGDSVKVTSTKKMYIVIDETKLSSEAGYEPYTADSATSVPWSGVTGKPSTYTPSSHTHDDRYYTESEIDSKLSGKANSSHTHTIANITNLQSTLDGKAASNHTHSQYLTSHQDISGKLDNSATGADSLLSKITPSWTSIPTDDTYFIRQDVGGGNTFGRVKFSTLWSYIKGKTDSVYAKVSHKHTKSEITDFPTSMPASDVYAWAKASSKPSYTYSEVGAAAANHSHSGYATTTTTDSLQTQITTINSNVATYYQPFGSSGASLKSGQNLNEFYSGVILGAGMGNAPDGDWWLVVSGGTGGTTVQRAYNLWSGRCNWRYCASGNWTAWQASLSCGDITGTGAITISNGNMTSAGVITNALRMPTRAGAQTTAKPNVYFDTNGNLYKTSTTSSKRFKEDVKPVENEDLNPENLYDIDVVQFKYKKGHFTNKGDPRYRKDMIGFIAENVYEHYPMAADYHIGDDGNVVCDGWNEQYLIPAMLKLIQDQHMQLINQEKKIKKLEDKVMFM